MESSEGLVRVHVETRLGARGLKGQETNKNSVARVPKVGSRGVARSVPCPQTPPVVEVAEDAKEEVGVLPVRRVDVVSYRVPKRNDRVLNSVSKDLKVKL